VSDATYAEANTILGERGVLDVVAVLGYYSFIVMSMKAFAMRPDGGECDPFRDRVRHRTVAATNT
jgi:4-carboxymuconolactone decarboxylase